MKISASRFVEELQSEADVNELLYACLYAVGMVQAIDALYERFFVEATSQSAAEFQRRIEKLLNSMTEKVNY